VGAIPEDDSDRDESMPGIRMWWKYIYDWKYKIRNEGIKKKVRVGQINHDM